MPSADEDAIRALIEAQFAALKWDKGGEANWAEFEQGFRADAQLVPAARPAGLEPVATFVMRMRRLAAQGVLQSFSERPLGIRIIRYGAVAVALAGCEMIENGDTVTRDVSTFLLVRSQDRWRIAAQAWDAETRQNPLAADLLNLSTPIQKE